MTDKEFFQVAYMICIWKGLNATEAAEEALRAVEEVNIFLANYGDTEEK